MRKVKSKQERQTYSKGSESTTKEVSIKFKRQKAKAEFKEGLTLDVCEDTADSASGLDVNCEKERHQI